MLTEVKKHLTPKQIWADAEFFFLLNLGLVATAAGIALFKTPNHFAFGGGPVHRAGNALPAI